MTDLVKHEPTLMEIIQQIAISPNARDQVEVMKEMLAMNERHSNREAERQFNEALVALQAEKPIITRDGTIIVKGIVRSRYATMDQIVDVMDPLMCRFGFALQVGESGIEDGKRKFVGILRHKAGHKESLFVLLPLDESPFRSAVQSESSTLSFARRLLYKMHFNIQERGQDNGEQNQLISADEVKDLEIKLTDTNSSIGQFCQYFEIQNVKDLKKADLARAHKMLDEKARRK